MGANSHVFSDRGIADSVGCRGQASFATVAGATAVETGHVNAVQVIVHATPWGARFILSIFLIRPSIGQGKGRGMRSYDRRGGKVEGRGIRERQQSVNMWLKRRSGEGKVLLYYA